MTKIKYLSKIFRAYLEPSSDKSCLFCGCSESIIIGRKYFLVQLRKCNNCGLLFRFPKEKSIENFEFYQSDYNEGFTTTLPSKDQLSILLKNKFIGSPKDISEKINFISSYASEGHVLDFGCSWGYSVWQFNNAGYKATGFEISKPRAKFGIDKLNVNIIDEFYRLESIPSESYEIIFSSHVLEHLTDISNTFQELYRLIKKNGILALFLPDCDDCDITDVFLQKRSFAFGEKHTIAFTSDFLREALKNVGFSIIYLENTQHFGFPEIVVIALKN